MAEEAGASGRRGNKGHRGDDRQDRRKGGWRPGSSSSRRFEDRSGRGGSGSRGARRNETRRQGDFDSWEPRGEQRRQPRGDAGFRGREDQGYREGFAGGRGRSKAPGEWSRGPKSSGAKGWQGRDEQRGSNRDGAGRFSRDSERGAYSRDSAMRGEDTQYRRRDDYRDRDTQRGRPRTDRREGSRRSSDYGDRDWRPRSDSRSRGYSQERDGSARPSRGGRAWERTSNREGRQDQWVKRDRDEQRWVPKPGTAPAKDEPEPPKPFDESKLPASVRAELKGLPKDLAETVGAHILAAGTLLDLDPELAYRHAEAARRRAGRLSVVREAAAEAAYAAGHYEVALREFRAIRRMNGGDELLPVIADCERAVGRHREALELLGTLDPRTKNLGLRIECLLVEAGIRDDLGQRSEAMRLLKAAISHQIGPRQGQARLRYSYAALLEDSGQLEAAREWYAAAAELDPETDLDIADRMAELDGVVLPEDFELAQEDQDDPDMQEESDPSEAETEVLTLSAPEANEAPGEYAQPPVSADEAPQELELISAEEEIAELLAEIDGANE